MSLARLSFWRKRVVMPALLLAGMFSLHATAEQWNIGAPQLLAIEQQYGTPVREKVAAWLALIDSHSAAPEPEKLERVNRFFNELHFRADADVWGVEDYWATPLEFLISGSGDCEDFSIAKYFTLRAMGVAPERMRLTYVRALRDNPVSQAHMVLNYYADDAEEPLVLDNLEMEIMAAAARTDLIPVYSFNSDGLWLAKLRGRGQLVGESSRLGPWSGMVQRMKEFWGN